MEGTQPNLMENGSVKPLSKHDLIRFIRSVVISNQKQHETNPFYVLDLGAIRSLVHTWFHNLPLVQPFYAVKCNPNPVFLEEMAALGTGFDCASRAEIETVLSLGVSPDRIVFANTCKPVPHIKYAAEVGVNLTTFDSNCELEKIRKWHPKCALLIRVKVPETSGATFKFGSKFGALPGEIIPLLRASQEAKLKVIGVSFHIGSRAINFNAFEDAIEVAKTTFDAAAKLGLPKLRILNIGGGFTSGPKFTEAASAVKLALQKHFPDEPGLKLMAEPGRFFANSSFTLATSVIGKRVRDEVKEYWIDDGVSGSMNFLKYDHDEVICTPLIAGKNGRTKEMKTWNSTVFGPTCDSADIVLKGFELPELEVDDKLVFHNMGAYTSSRGNDFNGFKTSAIPTYIVNKN
ncbi:Ornithine decarboxylase [Hibiscus syriacus]|uniref:ornithine decarboxylase n=1 Tax=Hibiscus syriacus TaxID=106335 RepID=A0A6A3D606_HIBSY|nr:ornithine decarboxylase-like [Hibiscus syriacus]KAE8734679.1 Ornithine decarboxylase [Hibiscus syriacus]